MNWLNIYGLIFVIVILLPNIVYTVKQSKKPLKQWRNEKLEWMEQIGRYGCMAFMIFDVPKLCKGFWFEGGKTVYLIVDIVLILAYLLVWVLMFNKISALRAILLSALPSLVFLLSGILKGSVLLVAAAVLFAASHITISYKSAFVQLMALSMEEENEN